MKTFRDAAARIPVFLLFLCPAPFIFSQVSVLTQHNDNSRTGQNLGETVLNTTNVNVNSFGKLFARAVDGYIYAQPLYLPNLSVGGKTRNVVYVATEHNSVYAFDADDPAATAPLWQVNLGPSVPSSDICAIITDPIDCPYLDLIPEIGITSTPVIDPASGTIYVIAKTKNLADSTYHFQLHALDLISGNEKFGGPKEITGQVNGTGMGSSNGVLTFDPLLQHNRPGLLLANGILYAAFGSVGDIGDFHGWVFGYNASSLQQEPGVFSATPNGHEGGIWQGGQGLVELAGNIFLMTGDGSFDANSANYGDSFVKLTDFLSVADYFTPSTQSTLDTSNIDLGSGGPMALPGTTLIVGIGKDGILRVVDTSNMGGFSSTSNNNYQNFLATTTAFMGGPVYWNSPNHGPLVYLWGRGDFLKAYAFSGIFQTAPVMTSTIQGASGYSNTIPLSVSSNGSQAGTGIVWAAAPYSGSSTGQTVPGIVRAFDASDLTRELWNSKQNATRDDVGNYAKFCPPTIANGKVYLATFSGELLVYGLNSPSQSSGISFVQVAAATPQPSSSKVTVSYNALQIAGDVNVVVVGWNDTTSAVQSVSDSAGNQYSLAIGPTKGTNISQSIYFAPNIAGGTNAVTVTFNQAAAYPDIRILEYSGIETASPLDVTAGASGNSATASSGPVTTNRASELLFASNTVATGNSAPVAPFVARIITMPNSDIVQDDVVASTSTYSASAQLTSAGPWVMQIATFKGAANQSSPQVTSVSPNSGSVAGGTPVTITGTNFSAGATVAFGANPATTVTVVSATSITATTPPGPAGTVSVTVTGPNNLRGTLNAGFTYAAAHTLYDFDGDGLADRAVFRPGSAMWYVIESGTPGGYMSTQWGAPTDKIVPADYDGDRKTDIAVWRPGNGVWYILPGQSPGAFIAIQWGQASDLPVPGDYDGDGLADIAVWRPESAMWYILPSKSPASFTSTQWGMSTDIPVPGDYDGDGKTDIAVWRPATGVWYVLPSGSPGSYTTTQWGQLNDKPVPGDYDGDGRQDIAVWRPNTGVWYIRPSSSPGSYTSKQWGLSPDVPVPGDYDGDRKTDIAVWRRSTGVWYTLPSGTPGNYTVTQWGVNSDQPLPGK